MPPNSTMFYFNSGYQIDFIGFTDRNIIKIYKDIKPIPKTLFTNTLGVYIFQLDYHSYRNKYTKLL